MVLATEYDQPQTTTTNQYWFVDMDQHEQQANRRMHFDITIVKFVGERIFKSLYFKTVKARYL